MDDMAALLRPIALGGIAGGLIGELISRLQGISHGVGLFMAGLFGVVLALTYLKRGWHE